MRTPTDKLISDLTKPMPRVAVLSLSALLVLVLGWLAFNYFGNYAEKAAKPLENALVKAGGVKQCSKGDSGRGPDSREPDYSAIYEMPGNQGDAAASVVEAARVAGFDLVKIPSPSGAPTDIFYEDLSKPSKYGVLEAGNMQLIVTIFSNRSYDREGSNCTLRDESSDTASTRTMIDFTVNMPAVKR